MDFWPFKSLERNYVSELDKFLIEFDRLPEAYSQSRLQEEAVYARIAKLRDHKESNISKSKHWENF